MYKKHEQGGVSMFVVVFATLLLSVITLGFVQLMLSDQRQATNSDLSQSAYDSAMAGVEDAKRVLLRQYECAGSTSSLCSRINTAVNSGDCDTVSKAISGTTANEKRVVTGTNDTTLDQAYTCVTISPNTDDYVVPSVSADDSVIVPLVGVSTFNQVKISWFTSGDAGGASMATLPSFAPELPTPQSSQWGAASPALLRAQFMQTNSSFTLDQFNDKNSKTLFLYPSDVGSTTVDYVSDSRRGGSGDPQQVVCNEDFSTTQYSCSVVLRLQTPVGGSAASRQNAFLNLSPLYNTASMRIQLQNSGTPVQFKGVQPSIDATGRANDVFRRVETRVEMSAEALYPRAALEVKGDVCKNFSVTNRTADYTNHCTP